MKKQCSTRQLTKSCATALGHAPQALHRPSCPMLQAAALELFSWLTADDRCPDAALPAAIRIARNALQALVPPGADDPAVAHQKCGIVASCMDLVWDYLSEMSESMSPASPQGRPSFLAGSNGAGAASPPPPQWLPDAVELAIRVLEHIGAPRSLPLSLPAACMAVCPFLSAPSSVLVSRLG
jgi:hypothetical protein